MNESRLKTRRARNLCPVGLTSLSLIAGLLLIGCSQESSSDPREGTPMVTIEGSDTMDVLLTSWSKEFMQNHPEIPVSVNSADSGSGIQALMEQRTDIAASSRDLTSAENKGIHAKGIHLSRQIVAMDSIAIIANPALPVTEISMGDLNAVFTGKKTDWSAFDPKSKGSINVCVREPGSGTSKYFSEHVLRSERAADTTTENDYTKNAKVLTSNEALVDAVAKDKNAIGYLGLSTALSSEPKIKVLKIKLLDNSPAVMPTSDAATNDYPLSRPLYFFYDSKAKPSVKQFAEYCLGSDGQKIVKDHGFVSIKN